LAWQLRTKEELQKTETESLAESSGIEESVIEHLPDSAFEQNSAPPVCAFLQKLLLSANLLLIQVRAVKIKSFTSAKKKQPVPKVFFLTRTHSQVWPFFHLQRLGARL
jgi:hypothetical protein